MDRWTIAELTDRVAERLRGHEAPVSGRVRAVPDQRTIRYYTTLGLLDRPVEMRGRTALYDRRHLVQLIAIKRLQGEGKSLAEIQATLAGAGRRELERIAAIGPAKPEDQKKIAAAARESFWLEPPSRAPAPEPESAPAPAPESALCRPARAGGGAQLPVLQPV